ncbi:MAG: DUF4159 domain-containing protein [Vicinamibacterales bacterium]
MTRATARALLLLAVVCGVSATGAAQDWRRYGGFFRGPSRLATPDSFDGSFNFCRLQYSSGRREEGGQGWRTDYPDADVNFSIRFSELTKTWVGKQPSGQPNHLVVDVGDDLLFNCPFVLVEDAGTIALDDNEVLALRQFLLKGGFVWADDFWGSRAWDAWVHELSRVLPPSEYPVRDLTNDHPLFRAMFDVDVIPQIPSIQFWRRSGGGTSERGFDSEEPHIRGISDAHGRLMVLMTHNTDISDAWEREGEDPRFFLNFSPKGYAVGINALVYAMSH